MFVAENSVNLCQFQPSTANIIRKSRRFKGLDRRLGCGMKTKVENGSHPEDQIEWINHKNFAEETENRNIKSSIFEMPFKICSENVTGPGM